MPESKRDPRKDPRPGDVYLLTDGNKAAITVREIMPVNRMDVNGIRRGSDYIQYRLAKYQGITMYMSVSGFKKRIAEVLHVAE